MKPKVSKKFAMKHAKRNRACRSRRCDSHCRRGVMTKKMKIQKEDLMLRDLIECSACEIDLVLEINTPPDWSFLEKIIEEMEKYDI